MTGKLPELSIFYFVVIVNILTITVSAQRSLFFSIKHVTECQEVLGRKMNETNE